MISTYNYLITGFEVGANGFALRVAELVVCVSSLRMRSLLDVYTQKKLWALSLHVDDDQRTIG
jgi:hypothetical protein